MARVTIDDDILTDVADAIRDKTETTDSISPLNFASLIESISGGGSGGESGEITPINTSTSIEIETELSEVHFIIIVRKTETNFANCDIALMFLTDNGGYALDGVYCYGVSYRSNWGKTSTSSCTSVPFEVDDGILTISTVDFSAGNNFTKGIDYEYYLF